MQSPKITIQEFIEKSPAEIGLEVLAGGNSLLLREISSPRIQKLGLALAGFAHYIHAGRVQILGNSENSFLEQLNSEDRKKAISNLDLEKISCILVTKNLEPPQELFEFSKKLNIPILRTSQQSSQAIQNVTKFLEEILAPQITIHGVLLGMYGIGVLLTGESGIGKSECALDLITRGHSLIADDAVVIKKIGKRLIGSSPELTHGVLEIRGLGIINVGDLFGVSAIGNKMRIELSIELKKWNNTATIERLGLETQEEEIFNTKITKVILPVSLGRNTTTLVETAVKVYLLRVAGHDAAQKLIQKHNQILSNSSNG
jgi:HPr kinase/phosphorylase